MAPEDRLLSTEEVAERLQVDEQTVRRWIKSGKLEAFKPGREWRIPPTAFEALLESYSSPKVTGPAQQLELEQRGADEDRRVINTLAPAVAAAQKSWEAYLEVLPGQPTPEVWKKESERIEELLIDAFAMYDALKEQGVLEAMGPYVAAIEAGESTPQPLRRSVIGLHNALAAMFVYTIPEARNWASRFSERVQLENIDRIAPEWAMKEPILETDTAQKND